MCYTRDLARTWRVSEALEFGIARIHCPDRGHDRLVAFSCKGRELLPPCGDRRMEDGAAWLCNRVLSPVSLRQWVLSLPKALRYLLAYNGALCRSVAGAAMQVIFHFLRQKAKRHGGCAAFWFCAQSEHPSGSGLRPSGLRPGNWLCRFRPLLPSFHCGRMVHSFVLDGVYVLDAFGAPAFFELPQPTLAGRIALAVLDLLRRKRIWLDEEDEDPVEERSPTIENRKVTR